MKMEQVYSFVNDAQKSVLGEQVVLKEDLTNVVELGDAIENANLYDAYVKALVNRIGKEIFVARAYEGGAPNVLRDDWEWGSICQKVIAELPDATENESWELEDGQSYDQNIFTKPKVSAKFYNNKVTFEIPLSVVDEQLKQSFLDAQSMNKFISMLYVSVETSMTIKTDLLIMRTINNFVGETMYAEYGNNSYGTSSHVKAVNLLYEYNDKFGQSLTQADCLYDLDFLKYASYRIARYKDHLRKASTLYNIGGKVRFTPEEKLHLVLLSDFARSSDVYLQSVTFHKELVDLPKYEVVTQWQGSGTDDAFGNASKIYVKTSGGHDVQIDGVLGVMFDGDGLGVNCYNRRTTQHRNDKAEFVNLWFKMDARYFNDQNENFVVFFAK